MVKRTNTQSKSSCRSYVEQSDLISVREELKSELSSETEQLPTIVLPVTTVCTVVVVSKH